MRLVTFTRGRSGPRLGAVVGPWDRWEAVVDLQAADRRLPTDMMSLLDACGGLSGKVWNLARKVVASAARARGGRRPEHVFSLRTARLRAPLAPRLLRDFIAFRGHIARTRAAMGSSLPPEWDEMPAYYVGNHLNVVGPGDPIPVLRLPVARGKAREIVETKKLDYEAEMGYVIGRRGRDVSAEAASRHLFGVTIFNDFSARDFQFQAGKVGVGPAPGKDWANALGPCIVTRDEFGRLEDKRIVVRVNGRERLNGTYQELVFKNPFVREGERALWSFEEMVEFLSRAHPIHAGEVWGSGTIPGGCELERGDDAQYLAPGDVVEIEAEGIGILRNPISRQE